MRTYRIVVFAAIALFAIAVAPFFRTNIAYLLNPASIGLLASGQWPVVLVWIAVFSAFSFFLFYPRQKNRWRKYSGIYVAYIVALFTEMFGFPLTLISCRRFCRPPRCRHSRSRPSSASISSACIMMFLQPRLLPASCQYSEASWSYWDGRRYTVQKA